MNNLPPFETNKNPKAVHPDTQAILDHYHFERLPVEGTLYLSTYRSSENTIEGKPAGTAIIALYSEAPRSESCFHRLQHDEVWHVYGGDPFQLILLHPDGSSEEILMGSNPLKGEKVQFVIPANTWQAGSIIPGGRYALFGNTMAPGFDGSEFEAGVTSELIKQYPDRVDDIVRLGVNDDITRMPDGFKS